MIHELCDMYGLKGMRPAYERNLCTLMFMATLLKVASECKQPIVQAKEDMQNYDRYYSIIK